MLELLTRQYPRDLLALDGLLKQESAGLSAELRSVRILPGSLLRWLEEEFSLSPHPQGGAEIEIPVSDLKGFDVQGETPRDRGQLIRVRVDARGWKRAGRVVTRPQGTILGAAGV